MRRALFSILLSMGMLTAVLSQSDPVSSQYMFNNLIYNPGSAGSFRHDLCHRHDQAAR
ncbi:MAG: type IX secretion system membrane protein PorP/SprF [Bacteroidales bacterium]